MFLYFLILAVGRHLVLFWEVFLIDNIFRDNELYNRIDM